jgi:hypothetical protein
MGLVRPDLVRRVGWMGEVKGDERGRRPGKARRGRILSSSVGRREESDEDGRNVGSHWLNLLLIIREEDLREL